MAAKNEISSFFTRLGADFKKRMENLTQEVNKLVKPKPKLWREWTPDLFEEFKAFYNGPQNVKECVQRLTRISAKLSERRFHYNTPEEEKQGQLALRSTLAKLLKVIHEFSKVQPRYQQTVQDCTLKALVRREFDLEALKFNELTLEPTCTETTRQGIREYRKILTDIFRQVKKDLSQKGLEHNHKTFLVRLFAVCFLRLPNVQHHVIHFLNAHIVHQRKMLEQQLAASGQTDGDSDDGSGSGSGSGTGTGRGGTATAPVTERRSGAGTNDGDGGEEARGGQAEDPRDREAGSAPTMNVYKLVQQVSQLQGGQGTAYEKEFCRQNPTIFKWDYFVNEFDRAAASAEGGGQGHEQQHPRWLRCIFCNGLWVCTFLSEYNDVIRLSLEASGSKPKDVVVWHLLPCYYFLVQHFCTLLRGFVVGLARRTINLWDMPQPEGDYDALEMRIDNGQTSLRTMLQYIQTSLHNPMLLRIYVHIVFVHTSLYDYPNMGRALDWVAGWCRCVALASPNGVIPRGCLDMALLIKVVSMLLQNEYAIGVSHALAFINNIVKFLCTADRTELWRHAILDHKPPPCELGPRVGAASGVSNFNRLFCNWNMAIRRMFIKLVVYQTFTVNRRFLPVASDRAVMKVPELKMKETSEVERTKEELEKLTLNLMLQDKLDTCLIPLLEQGKFVVGTSQYEAIPERIRPYVALAREQYKEMLISFYNSAQFLDNFGDVVPLMSLEGIH